MNGWPGPVVREQGTLEQVQQEFTAANRPTSLLKRFASPEEVANMMVYVCSRQAGGDRRGVARQWRDPAVDRLSGVASCRWQVVARP